MRKGTGMNGIRILSLSYIPLGGMIISGLVGLISLLIKNSRISNILSMCCYFAIIVFCVLTFIISIIMNVSVILGY